MSSLSTASRTAPAIMTSTSRNPAGSQRSCFAGLGAADAGSASARFLGRSSPADGGVRARGGEDCCGCVATVTRASGSDCGAPAAAEERLKRADDRPLAASCVCHRPPAIRSRRDQSCSIGSELSEVDLCARASSSLRLLLLRSLACRRWRTKRAARCRGWSTPTSPSRRCRRPWPSLDAQNTYRCSVSWGCRLLGTDG